MNREILFRGKRVDNGEWVYGYLYIHNGYSGTSALIRGDKILDTEVDIKTIGQSTGLTDKNGKKIFDGDIVQWSDVKMEIFWGEDIGMGYGFCWRPYGETQFYHESITGFIDEYEVIGNIYDKRGD